MMVHVEFQVEGSSLPAAGGSDTSLWVWPGEDASTQVLALVERLRSRPGSKYVDRLLLGYSVKMGSNYPVTPVEDPAPPEWAR